MRFGLQRIVLVVVGLLVAAPLAAAETPEAEPSPTPTTLEVAATVACAGADATSALGVFSCPDEVASAAEDHANSECAEGGQQAANVTVSCTYLGGGSWRYRASFRCTDILVIV